MFKNSRFVTVLALLALIISTLACDASSSSQPVEGQPVQSMPAIEPPAANETNPNAIMIDYTERIFNRF